MTRVLLWIALSLSVAIFPASAKPRTLVEVDPITTAVLFANKKYSRLDHARKAAGWLRPPTRLPQGYSFLNAEIDSEKKEAWLRYATDKNVFSIFQQRTVEEKNADFTPIDGGFYWQDGKDRFLIAGLSEAQAKIVAQSVK